MDAQVRCFQSLLIVPLCLNDDIFHQIAWIVIENMEYDPFFQQVFADMPQSKTSKTKIAVFGAGADSYSCWYVAFGDHLTLMRRPVYDEDSPNWFFPSLRGSQSPGQTVGSFIKQLLPRSKGGAARFEKFAVDEIPQNASAGGARPGVCNTLASCMPAELAV